MANISFNDFNDKDQAFVSFDEFNRFMDEMKEDGDYSKEDNGITFYYAEGGYLLGKYYQNEGYGVIY